MVSMTVRGNNRQKNVRCYKNLERQLIIEWETCRPCSSSTGGISASRLFRIGRHR